MNWEYSYMRSFGAFDPQAEWMEVDRRDLTQKGADRWELVGMNGDYYLLKRPIQQLRAWTGPR